jgi:flagellar hook-associated protein 3 FlgL
MTEQITTQMQSSTMLANLNSDLAQLDKTQDEMSTGLQITQPSDNPYGTALSLQLNTQISSLSSYTSNINDGTAWVQTASSSLQSIQQMVERVRELVVESANGTNSSSDLTDAADEVNSLIDGIKQDADTEYNGQYIFSGTATDTEPYETGATDTYQGNTAAINRAIGPGGTTLQINANLSSVLGSGTAAADGGLLDTLRTVVSDMQSGNTTGLSNDLTSLDSNITSLESVQANVGAAQDRLQMASTRITSLQTTDQTELSNVEDVDLGQASINFTSEQAGYQAALQSSADIVQTSLLNFLQS